MNLIDSFQRAINEQNHRQTFLDDITNQGLPRHVEKLTYIPEDLSEFNYSYVMATHLKVSHHFRIHSVSTEVKVFPKAFSLGILHQNLDDFMSTLEDHEYFHSKELYETPKLIINSLFTNMAMAYKMVSTKKIVIPEKLKQREIRAYQNQVDNFYRRNCSEFFKEDAFRKLKNLKVFEHSL